MSGSSESLDCPRCGTKESLEAYEDNDDGHPSVGGECLECGYEYHTDHSVMTLEEVNEARENGGLEPLSELKDPLSNWKNWEV